ncbi:TetR/AcrR family transcriptional regulator C-terminal domain-containing protein [Catenulispora sp. NF23]|uniref:TetR/AcrR family transcriptional regulator C-terminal domain-containing protein n=1 Tax=Catenulispora pinistramenti TaxID=2705254 RepID=A0ABS5KNB2_9ACTN|nr:TetR/AcrR family transcriptional regulator [Catenulispora pinistramenti]MBS2532840.1 TetR/AcrR family transcriptional regulator C-terminal domain-containing protein [Catenulispora pinistramenti]MBS2547517.1 TetR/AcrR family transcriptional regulator C-terminal domain-containing protein [Catenulispora pinistramenti]
MDCRVCGTALTSAGRGRPPRYCSRACRSKAYRERVAERGVEPAERMPLGVEQIVRAAIELADDAGAQALTMRGVAARLGVGVMSLYRYVSGRDELIDLITDAVFGERSLPDSGGPQGWRARLELSARSEWALYQAHPWLPRVADLISHPPASTNLLAYTDWRLRAVAGCGFPYSAMVQIAALVSSFVQSIALAQGHGPRTGGLNRRDWMAARKEAFDRSSRNLPMVSRFGEEALQATESQALFEFGLERLLDGFGLMLEPARPS